MAGIYGSHPEDKYFERELNRYLDNLYARDEKIEALENDIYQSKLDELSTITDRRSKDGNVIYKLNYLQDEVLPEISSVEFAALGRAIKEGTQRQVGEILIAMVQKELRKQARQEAEDELDNRD